MPNYNLTGEMDPNNNPYRHEQTTRRSYGSSQRNYDPDNYDPDNFRGGYIKRKRRKTKRNKKSKRRTFRK